MKKSDKENFNFADERLNAFSRNIELCKDTIFDITYADITRYTGIPQPTMLSYDKRGVSPYISVAKQIADFYCCGLDTLCDKPINYFVKQNIQMLKRFILRVEGDYSNALISVKGWIDNQLSVTELDLYREMLRQLKGGIAKLNKEERVVAVGRGDAVVSNFTKNFHDLHTYANVSYRKMSGALDISIGNLTRLEKGGEPMLNTVIKLADYFGITVEEILSENPKFDYKQISDGIGKLNASRYQITPDDESEYRRMSANILTKEQAKKLLIELLA